MRDLGYILEHSDPLVHPASVRDHKGKVKCIKAFREKNLNDSFFETL